MGCTSTKMDEKSLKQQESQGFGSGGRSANPVGGGAGNAMMTLLPPPTLVMPEGMALPGGEDLLLSGGGTGMVVPVLSAEQQEVVRTTWLLVENDLPVIAKQLFLCIFDQDPRVKRLFPFRDAWGDELTSHPQFVAHSARFMAVIKGAVAAVANLEDTFGPALISLGARHTRIGGFRPELFELFQSSMVVVWGNHLRSEMTPQINTAWTRLFAFIVRKLQQGYYGQARMEEIVNTADIVTANSTSHSSPPSPVASLHEETGDANDITKRGLENNYNHDGNDIIKGSFLSMA